MELLMNGQSVDLQLEDEKTLKDVAASITEWASKRDLVFTGVYVDGSEFYVSEEVPETPIESVESIDLAIQSRSELIIASLTEASSYCDRVLEYIASSKENGEFNMEELEPFFSGIDWLLDVTASVFNQLDLDVKSIRHLDKTVADYLSDITRMAADLKTVSKENDPKAVIEFLDEQKGIFELFKGIFRLALLSDNIKAMIVKGIDSPDTLVKSLIDTKEALVDQLDNLEKISEAFQSGNDASAGEMLHDFLDFMYTLSRSVIQSAPVFAIDPSEVIVEGVTIEEKNGEINSLLTEIVEVMENDDIVSVADILEYELKPALEPMPDYIDILLERIGA